MIFHFLGLARRAALADHLGLRIACFNEFVHELGLERDWTMARKKRQEKGGGKGGFLHGTLISSIHYTRCKITNLCPDSCGFPGYIVFDDCDFTQLHQEQRQRLRPYGNSDSKRAKKFCTGGP